MSKKRNRSRETKPEKPAPTEAGKARKEKAAHRSDVERMLGRLIAVLGLVAVVLLAANWLGSRGKSDAEDATATAAAVERAVGVAEPRPGEAVAELPRAAAGPRTASTPIDFGDVRSLTREFIGYYHSIELTPAQEKVKHEALSAIRAPCCSDNTAYTCCCPCNMAKTWWGLSNHLIADQGLGAQEVKAAVETWIETINPDGFTGNACYTGRCGRPFAQNGCGGMNESQIVF